LTGDVAETVGGEVGAKDKQFAVIKTTQARIGKDSLAHLVKSCRGGVGPVWFNPICVLVLEDDPKRRDAHFEMGNEASIELDESDKLCDIADQFQGRPRFYELVFRHGWSIAVDAYIDTNEFKPFDKDVRFLQTEG
jgi:hypothetical protein